MLVPLRGKLIVEIIKDEKRTTSGLYIAETVTEIPHKGTITSLGLPWRDDHGKEHAWGLEIGEIVHFVRKWDEYRGNSALLVRKDIIAVSRIEENSEGKEKECFRAFADQIIIRRVYTGKIGASSIIIPDVGAIRSNSEDFYGEVISVGSENKMGIKFGDKLLYERNEGLKCGDYWSIKPRAILAKI